MIFQIFWYSLVCCILCIRCEDHVKGSLTLDKNLHLSWRVNLTKRTIRFAVKAKIDTNGWFLVGFSSQANGTKKIAFQDISGEAFVVWSKSLKTPASKPDWQMSECFVAKGKLQKHKDHNVLYHLGSKSYNNKTQTLKAIVWRPFKGKSSRHIEIKHGPLIVFGSFGNGDKTKITNWKQRIKKLNDGEVDDAFKEKFNVDLFKMLSKHKDRKANPLEKAAKIAEKHWLGVVVGVAAFLTILITCTVYCVTKKTQREFKRAAISIPFHKGQDGDEEAKVAFLQSEET